MKGPMPLGMTFVFCGKFSFLLLESCFDFADSMALSWNEASNGRDGAIGLYSLTVTFIIYVRLRPS